MNEATIITLIVVPFLVLIIILMLRELYNLAKCQKWPSVEGELLDSGVIDGDSDRPFYASIKYEYEINSKKYKSRRIAFLKWWGTEKYARKIIEKYRSNKPIKIYYNPSNPKQSVLERMPAIFDIVLTILCIFIVSYGAYLGVMESL